MTANDSGCLYPGDPEKTRKDRLNDHMETIGYDPNGTKRRKTTQKQIHNVSMYVVQ